MAELTASQIKKAGRSLRRHLRRDDIDPFEVADALDVLLAFRAAHAGPLVTANNGLRSMVRTEACRVEVSQRLKRVPTILDKLLREPSLALNNMQDIGGVRAVLDSIDEVRRVERRLKRNRPVVGYSDYITTPRDSGYRGIHVVVTYGDRRIEVQLRTRTMHQWAITVERMSGRLGHNLKGEGIHPIQRLMAKISEAMAIEETGGVVPQALLDEMDTLRAEAAPYL